MSVRKQEQQRLRRARQAASQPIIYEDNNVGLPTDPKSVPAPPAPELDTCLDVFSTALANPNTALLRRVFFIAEDKSKFVSVGYYPARGYQPLAEFGGAKKPLLLDVQQLQTMAENIATLCNALSTKEHFSKKDGDFKMNTTGTYRIARVYLGKQYLSFT